MPVRLSEMFLSWAKESVAGPIGSMLGSYRDIMNASLSLEAVSGKGCFIQSMESVVIKVPPKYTRSRNGMVSFWIVLVAVEANVNVSASR